jgi:ribonuclease HII
MSAIAGVDEAGRGPLAGPVVAAAVLFVSPPSLHFPDSKSLSPGQRLSLARLITREAADYAVVCVSHRLIDRIGILPATARAATLAVSSLRPPPATILVDGPLPLVSGFPSVICVPHGDRIRPEIGAASILAKTFRDFLMQEYHLRFPEFSFHRHRGYGAPHHLALIRSLNPSPIHRISFRPLSEVTLFAAR